MAQVIATNTLSQLTQNNLDKSQKAQNQAIERLSSGQRINSAKDDAAGLAISDRMTSQVNGLKQANRNANDGMSMAQTAESALGAVTDNLQRVRELVVQAANGTYTDEDRQSINNEIDARLQEVDRIGKDTTFNQKQLLGSTGTTATALTDTELTTKLQIGAFDGQTIDLKLTDVRTVASTLKGGSDYTTAGNKLIDGTGKVQDSALATIDAQIKAVDSTRSTLGAQQNRLESTVESNAATATNLSAAKSQISDADYAAEVSAMSTAQILQQAGQNVLSQANSVPQNVLSLLK
ncbi:flagellin N-terminal helical domain-containing protein [Zymobacter palmae]|uniref:Flagellin n=1 Tax=Zymobacter palmae TaxID=33074 RepID=A0A348HFD2_9GAMM|nr:flagellin [Zymobacter palmae]BBG30334.1 flagellin and related hook-associated proteins [Zymobacter palmae]